MKCCGSLPSIGASPRVRRSPRGRLLTMKTAPCPVAFELQDVQPASALETARRGSRLVSRKVGVSRRVVETSHQAQDPLIFTAGVVPADYSRCVNGGLALN